MSEYVLWTSELSPFSLKIKSCLKYAGHTYVSLPRDGGRIRNLYTALKIELGKKKRSITKFPSMTALDEYPGMPFLMEKNGKAQYDSSALARWLDVQPDSKAKLYPNDAALNFVAQLIDEAMDEYMLYIAHHLRWSTSVTTNNAAERLAEEFKRLPIMPKKEKLIPGFKRRQIVRLPYLFSMPPQDFDAGLSKLLTAPIKKDWPETHSLLNKTWHDYLDAVEAVLSAQPYVLGDQFTIADASVYGMFGMLLDDPAANEEMKERAPAAYRWLLNIKAGKHVGSSGELYLSDKLASLLAVISDTFVPLMKQNENAYEAYRQKGETLFNEPAILKDKSIYEGELQGHSFRAVAKSFQVQAWRDVLRTWSSLAGSTQERLTSQFAPLSDFSKPSDVQVKLVS